MQVVDRILAISSRRVVQQSSAAYEAPNDSAQPTALAKRNGAAGTGLSPARGLQRFDPRASLLQQQCLKLALSIFAGTRSQVRSLGFTSSIAGEGKTFLASATAVALARKANRPVVLVDCNWDHPSLHEMYNLPDAPGLAEWARGECDLATIRHQVAPHLTVIPAGLAMSDSINLTSSIASHGINSLLTEPTEVLVADMPSVLTSAYGSQLAQELDAVTLVVRARTTWDSFVAEAYNELENAQVEGVVLNATQSRIPRWIQRML
jgi:Mrp family chromosome partitioning ATPase